MTRTHLSALSCWILLGITPGPWRESIKVGEKRRINEKNQNLSLAFQAIPSTNHTRLTNAFFLRNFEILGENLSLAKFH